MQLDLLDYTNIFLYTAPACDETPFDQPFTPYEHFWDQYDRESRHADITFVSAALQRLLDYFGPRRHPWSFDRLLLAL